jgi:hypothetical protein
VKLSITISLIFCQSTPVKEDFFSFFYTKKLKNWADYVEVAEELVRRDQET